MSTPPRNSRSLTGNFGYRGICPECTPNEDTRIAFAIRAWNKSADEMTRWKVRMERILSPLAADGGLKDVPILFVIPHHHDADFNLYGRVANMTILGRPVTPLTFVQPDNTVEAEWTAGLNLGVAYMANVVPQDIWGETQMVFMSFDTDMDESNARTMAESLRLQTGFIARRLMPRNVAYIPSFTSARRIIECVAQRIREGDIPSEEMLYQLAQCNRNTLAAWPLSTFSYIGMFDPSCGRLGGMEDIFLLLRRLLDDTTSYSLPETELDYHDIRIATLRERNPDDKDVIAQRTKLHREVETLEVICDWLTLEHRIRNGKKDLGMRRMHLSPHHGEFTMNSKLFSAS
ncbi:MAG: hypothetical protein Q7R63_00450 [bacterium]|nr:hypothetical protein [bacterium]